MTDYITIEYLYGLMNRNFEIMVSDGITLDGGYLSAIKYAESEVDYNPQQLFISDHDSLYLSRTLLYNYRRGQDCTAYMSRIIHGIKEQICMNHICVIEIKWQVPKDYKIDLNILQNKIYSGHYLSIALTDTQYKHWLITQDTPLSNQYIQAQALTVDMKLNDALYCGG